MSEFGACMDSSECVTEVTQVTDVADQHLAGWRVLDGIADQVLQDATQQLAV